MKSWNLMQEIMQVVVVRSWTPASIPPKNSRTPWESPGYNNNNKSLNKGKITFKTAILLFVDWLINGIIDPNFKLNKMRRSPVSSKIFCSGLNSISYTLSANIFNNSVEKLCFNIGIYSKSFIFIEFSRSFFMEFGKPWIILLPSL